MTGEDLEFEMCPWPDMTYVFNGGLIRLGTTVIGVMADLDTAQRVCDLLNFFGVNDLADLASIEGEQI